MASAVSPRNVVLKNLRRQVLGDGPAALAAASSEGDDREKLPLPRLGDMQLHSFYKPSLEAGTYTIKASQDVGITYNPDPKTKKSTTTTELLPLGLKGETTAIQTFEVIAPRFAIDPKDIHSTYPPQGHADQPSVLPHIVFNDPHLPWERGAPGITDKFSNPDQDSIPWLAVFPFDCNGTTPEQQELRLTPAQLNGPYAVFKKFSQESSDTAGPQGPGGPSVKTPVELKQSAFFTLPMTVSDYLVLANPPDIPEGSNLDPKNFTKVRIPPFRNDPDYSEFEKLNTPVEVLFMSGKLFKQLFPLNDQKLPDVTPFRYLSHVRNVNTEGMVQASAEDAETGLFSIIHSKRTGPTDVAQNTPPRPQIVHMLSLEYVDQMTGIDIMADDELVAFVSLHRWNYLCQPPLSVNFVDAMRDLGESMKDTKDVDGSAVLRNNLLRLPETVLTQMRLDLMIQNKGTGSLKPDKVTGLRSAMLERLQNGYTLVKHRTASGEETVAINRGPLIPTSPASLPAKWPFGSNFGQDYQIFDRTLGMMDISYSSAWQIGKLLAISDLGFVASLLRVRSMAHMTGKRDSQIMSANMALGMKDKQAVFSTLLSSAAASRAISATSSHAELTVPDLRQRWSHTAPVSEDSKAASTLAANPMVANAFSTGIRRQVANSASAAGTTDAIFDEVALAANPDWAYVHTWIMDRLYLTGLPTHYYIGDAAFLPPESIRFFQIDTNWMDCFIDGALSVANHMGQNDDQVREAIKDQLNEFFKTKYTNKTGQPLHYPQVPRYGFFLRSAVVTIFPDLTLDIPYPDEATGAGRVPIPLQKHLGKDVLMVLLDRPPEDIVKIKITQPAHQQRFSAGDNLDQHSLDFLFRQIYKSAKTDGTLPTDFFHEFGPLHRYNNSSNPPAAPTDPAHVEAEIQLTQEPLYDWTTRCLDLIALERYLLGKDGVYSEGTDASMRTEWGPNDGIYQQLSSAMTALTLNDTMKFLEIKGLNYDNARKSAQVPYGIRTRKVPAQLKAVNRTLASMRTGPAMEMPLLGKASSNPLPAIALQAPVAAPSTSLRAEALQHPTVPAHLTRLAPLAGASVNLPINITRAAATVAGPAAGPPAPAQIFPVASDRSFRYAIFPSTSKFVPALQGQPNSNSYVFIDTPFVPDLIFSVNINPVATNQIEVIENGKKVKKSLWLREIQFKIPVGDSNRRKGSADIQGLGLVPDNASAGLRGRMLDNQRWVIHLDPGAEYMVVRIIPRSTRMATPVEWNRNLSFKLMEVDIAGTDVPSAGEPKPPTGMVEIRVSELYGFLKEDGKTWQDQGRASWTWKLMRRTGWASGWRPAGPS
ncbi:hypothetical protein EJ04DRAFT_574290 [Polyplosphaeria fusca]|uniref:Uncharacterized protein n=1 Tax=Polyplosphaeria fusca TaxID=682080 RepID=A0A9P4R6L8_9PLEO|nr:hypothetical protein EJ04DRAFT_574290 [Polyplosphaeria fusca]